MVFLIFVAVFVTLACVVVPLATLAVIGFSSRNGGRSARPAPESPREGAQPAAPRPARRPQRETVIT